MNIIMFVYCIYGLLYVTVIYCDLYTLYLSVYVYMSIVYMSLNIHRTSDKNQVSGSLGAIASRSHVAPVT